MNPQNPDQIPSMELPAPVLDGQNLQETHNAAPVTETGAAQAVEQGVSMPATQGSPVADPAAFVDPNLGPTPAVSPTTDPGSLLHPTTSFPPIADDNDLIEKEWVEKAKQIVEQTKLDPHTQNKEMSKMKADYLKKRYNKEVKLVEE